MAPKNPLTLITDTADKAVGVVAAGVRVTASLINSTADRAKSMVGMEDGQGSSPTRAPAQSRATSAPAAPVEPTESIADLAEAAVAREMAEEPVTATTPSNAARATAPTKSSKPKAASSNADAADDDEPLIDAATAKAVKSETDVLRAAADPNKNL